MRYKIVMERKALKFIKKQSPAEQKRLLSAIYLLPDMGDRKRLKAAAELYRLRVGDYRIVYTLDHGQLVVFVIDAGPRGDIYKRY